MERKWQAMIERAQQTEVRRPERQAEIRMWMEKRVEKEQQGKDRLEQVRWLALMEQARLADHRLNSWGIDPYVMLTHLKILKAVATYLNLFPLLRKPRILRLKPCLLKLITAPFFQKSCHLASYHIKGDIGLHETYV